MERSSDRPSGSPAVPPDTPSATQDHLLAPISSQRSPYVRFGPFAFDPGERILYRGTREVSLPPRALGVLAHLVTHPGKLVSKHALMGAVWKDAVVTETSLIEAISVVRQALGDDPQQPTYIQTIHRRGYRFLAPPPVVHTEALDPTSKAQSDSSPEFAPALEPASGNRRWIGAILGIAAFAILMMVGLRLWSASVQRPVTRAVVTLLPRFSPELGMYPTVAITPDGAAVAYVVASDDGSELMFRTMNRFDAVPIRGTRGAAAPFFSPDGKWLAFFSDGMLRKVAVNGGTPQALVPAPDGHGGVWGADDWIVFSPDREGGLAAVRADGTRHRVVTKLDPGGSEISHRWPDRLGDPNTVIATVWRRDGKPPSLYAFALDTGRARRVADEVVFGRYAPTGHLVFVQRGNLFAVPFDREQLEFRGAPVRIVDAAYVHPTTGAAHFAFSRTGSFVFVPAGVDQADRRMNLVMEWFGELRQLAKS